MNAAALIKEIKNASATVVSAETKDDDGNVTLGQFCEALKTLSPTTPVVGCASFAALIMCFEADPKPDPLPWRGRLLRRRWRRRR